MPISTARANEKKVIFKVIHNAPNSIGPSLIRVRPMSAGEGTRYTGTCQATHASCHRPSKTAPSSSGETMRNTVG
ncbi:hypothetical protein D3C85_1262530 [compost metagenome]